MAADWYVAFLGAYFLMQIIVDNELDNNDRRLMASFAFGMAFLWNRAYLAYHRVPSALRRHLQVVQKRSRAASVRVLFPSQTLWKIAAVMEQVAALTQWERTRFHAWGTAGLEHFFGDARGKG